MTCPRRQTDDEFWNDLCDHFGRFIGPLPEAEAQRAYDEAEEVPLSDERIRELVEYATKPAPNEEDK